MKNIIKIVLGGGTVIVTAPASWPAAAVLLGGACVVGAAGYLLHETTEARKLRNRINSTQVISYQK